jgi:hypothetical protein
MAPDPPPRTATLVGTLGVGAVTAWAMASGQPLPLLAFLVTATAVMAVGASREVAAVASWYYVLQSAVLGQFGVGLILLGYATPLVLGLTAGFVIGGSLFAVRYSRSRRTVQPSDEGAP